MPGVGNEDNQDGSGEEEAVENWLAGRFHLPLAKGSSKTADLQ
jgi:hypothetical protein